MTTKIRNQNKAPVVAAAPKDARKIASVIVDRKNLVDLHPHPKNPRKHPERGSPKYDALKESLEHDYFDPIVWNKRNGMLVSGHLRTKILMGMGYAQADVIVVDYDENTHRARMLAANKLMGGDDKERQKTLFEEMLTNGTSIALAGMTHDEWSKFIDGSGKSEKSEPEYPIVAKLGEAYDYVLVFTNNETDKAFLFTLLGIEKSRSYNPHKGITGMGRVVPFEKFLKCVKDNADMVEGK